MAPDEDGPAPPAVQDEDVAPPLGAEPSPEERRVVGSPHAFAANAALLALTRSARSFTLYDPSNKVVRTLIGDYRDKLRKVLEAFGSLVLEVHPFELVLGREVVYLERDRERSLSFRLFRDGVRRIGFEPGMTWEEMLRLLQILSIRYTGVRQQEDDLVTLLRKAALRPCLDRRHRGIRPRGGVRGAPDRRPAPRHHRALRRPGAVGPAAPALPGGRAPAAPAGGGGAVGAAAIGGGRGGRAEGGGARGGGAAPRARAPGPRGRARLRPRGAGVPAGRAAGGPGGRARPHGAPGARCRHPRQPPRSSARSSTRGRSRPWWRRCGPIARSRPPPCWSCSTPPPPARWTTSWTSWPRRGRARGRPSCAASWCAASSTRRRRSSPACATRAGRRRWCCCASSRTWTPRPRSTRRSRSRRRGDAALQLEALRLLGRRRFQPRDGARAPPPRGVAVRAGARGGPPRDGVPGRGPRLPRAAGARGEARGLLHRLRGRGGGPGPRPGAGALRPRALRVLAQSEVRRAFSAGW